MLAFSLSSKSCIVGFLPHYLIGEQEKKTFRKFLPHGHQLKIIRHTGGHTAFVSVMPSFLSASPRRRWVLTENSQASTLSVGCVPLSLQGGQDYAPPLWDDVAKDAFLSLHNESTVHMKYFLWATNLIQACTVLHGFQNSFTSLVRTDLTWKFSYGVLRVKSPQRKNQAAIPRPHIICTCLSPSLHWLQTESHSKQHTSVLLIRLYRAEPV